LYTAASTRSVAAAACPSLGAFLDTHKNKSKRSAKFVGLRQLEEVYSIDKFMQQKVLFSYVCAPSMRISGSTIGTSPLAWQIAA
jgi:hypothetical protein